MFREGELAAREGRMTKYQIAGAALNGVPWRDTESAARNVAEWAARNLYKKPRDLLRINPKMVLDEAIGGNWEAEIRKGKGLRLKIRAIADWACDHMVIDPKKCWACSKPSVSFYRDLPVCGDCLRKCGQPNPEELSMNVKRVMETIDGVYAKAAKKPVIHNHREMCTQRNIRHSYYVKTPAGFLIHDLGLTPNQRDCQMWTRDELEFFVKPQFKDIGTPLEIFRVVK
jgi:hypothetical protein